MDEFNNRIRINWSESNTDGQTNRPADSKYIDYRLTER